MQIAAAGTGYADISVAALLAQNNAVSAANIIRSDNRMITTAV